MLTDEAKIYIKAGKGGDGAISFRREKYVPKGGPDGGDGGDGGDIFLVCKADVQTLTNYARKKEWLAKNGENGRSKKQTGKSSDDLELIMPPGTIVEEKQEGDKSEGEGIIHDFIKEGDRLLIARGGHGGWGNVHFASATSQSPVFAQKGTQGEEKHLILELKLIADVGIIGLPNSGKSTLLSRISNARPKIADYPFTTLEPNLGVSSFHGKELIFADIPGLITGASEGKGLGDKFLRHIERTKMLVHLIDINSDNPKSDYEVIRSELKSWNPDLLKREEIVVLNKADTMLAEEAKKISLKFSKEIGKPIKIISAVSGEGISEFLNAIS